MKNQVLTAGLYLVEFHTNNSPPMLEERKKKAKHIEANNSLYSKK